MGQPAAHVVGLQALAGTGQVRTQRGADLLARAVIAHLVTLGAERLPVDHDPHGVVRARGVLLLPGGLLHQAAAGIGRVGDFGAGGGREVVHQRSRLGRREAVSGHAQHRGRAHRRRGQQVVVKPRRPDLLALAHQRRRHPAPRLHAGHRGPGRPRVGQRRRVEQARKRPALRRPFGGDLVLVNQQVGPAHGTHLAANHGRLPELEAHQRQRLALLVLFFPFVHQDVAVGAAHGHAHHLGRSAPAAVGGQRSRHLLGRKPRLQKGEVLDRRRRLELVRVVLEPPPLHLQCVALGTGIAVQHLLPLDDRPASPVGLVDVPRRGRLGHQPQHKRDDRLPLLGREGEPAHREPLGVRLVGDLLVIEAPRAAELLPEEALAALPAHRLHVEPPVRVFRLAPLPCPFDLDQPVYLLEGQQRLLLASPV